MGPSHGRQRKSPAGEIRPARGRAEIWIEVGAHEGEYTLQCAAANRNLRVYAFEPNLRLAMALAAKASNYTVLPMAVGERDGTQDFFLTEPAGCSSLLPFDEAGLAKWVGGEVIERKGTIPVPVIRLDTFMELVGIDRVDFLKIDAQGADLAVVRSAGNRLNDIRRICLEVQITPFALYAGGSKRQEVLDFLCPVGFRVIGIQSQSHGQEEVLTFERE